MTKLLVSGSHHGYLDDLIVYFFQTLEPTGEQVLHVVAENLRRNAC